MSPRSLICLMLVAGLATAAFADAQIAKVDGAAKPAEKKNEAGQNVNKAQDSGPDSWQFWGPQRQLLAEGAKVEKKEEAGQKVQKDSGPDSWQFWAPQRQLLATGSLQRPIAQKSVNEAGQAVQKDAGPDSWQFWAPQRQLLAEADKQNEKTESVNERGNGRGGASNGGSAGPNSWQFYRPARQLLADKPAAAAAPQKPAAKPEAAPKPQTTPQAAPKPQAAKKPESAPKQTALKPTPAPQGTQQPEAAPKQQQGQQQAPAQAPQGQNERGFRGWGWAGNADLAGIPGGGNAYPLMNNRRIYTAAGWGGAPTTCAQGELAHACSTRKLLRKLLGMH